MRKRQVPCSSTRASCCVFLGPEANRTSLLSLGCTASGTLEAGSVPGGWKPKGAAFRRHTASTAQLYGSVQPDEGWASAIKPKVAEGRRWLWMTNCIAQLLCVCVCVMATTSQEPPPSARLLGHVGEIPSWILSNHSLLSEVEPGKHAIASGHGIYRNHWQLPLSSTWLTWRALQGEELNALCTLCRKSGKSRWQNFLLASQCILPRPFVTNENTTTWCEQLKSGKTCCL